MSSSPEEITLLLQRLQEGGKGAFDEVLPLIYRELRTLADRHLHKERASHTLQPTALVHEAYMRMVGQKAGFQSRLQFLRVAAMMMRRVLIDHARERQRAKRQAGQLVELTESAASAPEAAVDLMELDEALKRLEDRDARKVRIVELRYFGGLTIDETAEVLGVSAATVNRDWEVARLWLLREIEGRDGGSSA